MNKIGTVKLMLGDRAGALAAFDQGLGIARKLAAKAPGNVQAQRDVSTSLGKIGDVKLKSGDEAGALAAYGQALDIARKLSAQTPDAEVQRDIAVGSYNIGKIKLEAGDHAGALRAFNDALDIARKLAATHLDNRELQRGVMMPLRARNPGDTLAKRDVMETFEKIGKVTAKAGEGRGGRRLLPTPRLCQKARVARTRQRAGPMGSGDGTRLSRRTSG